MIQNFQIQNQLLSNWCWAAVASSISRYYNNNSPWTQGTLAANLTGHDSCSVITKDTAPIAPPVCNQVLDVASALKVTGNFVQQVLRPLTFNEVIGQVQGGWPVCCQISWDEYTTSHFVVVYGFNANMLVVGDPEAGVCSVDYTQFTTGYRGGKWSRSIATQAVQPQSL